MKEDRVVLAHGGGGTMARRLIEDVIAVGLSNPVLDEMADAAVFDVPRGRLAFTTDTFVVRPLFFRGGDIGRLAVSGTVNDLAAAGAAPLGVSLGLVLEEGFPLDDLRRIIGSVRRTADEAGVRVVCGDTKVVGRGEADGIFINTSGVGAVRAWLELSPCAVAPGDVVIVNGPLGEHGVAVVSEREGLAFETPVVSDVAPLWGLVERVLEATTDLHVMRDPTRGGLAGVLNELADAAEVTVVLSEDDLPVSPPVAAACDMLGFDVLSVANEGKMVVICPEGAAGAVLDAMRSHPLGRAAVAVGRVEARRGVGVVMRTRLGGERVVDAPYGEELPRIC